MEIKFKEKPKKDSDICKQTAQLVTELLNAAVSFHKLHLSVTGQGSFAKHKATNQAYDELPNHADEIAEQSMGAYEEILKYEVKAPITLLTAEEGLSYANQLKEMITNLQSKTNYSEIVNILDETKSTLNSLKYQLLFLS